jgi:hypothetical protein
VAVEAPVDPVLADLFSRVGAFVDARFGIDTSHVEVGLLPADPVRLRKDARGRMVPAAMADQLAGHIRLRGPLLDAMSRFLGGEFSSGIPLIDGVERAAMERALLGLRVLFHERIHAVQDTVQMITVNDGWHRVVREGLTQLTADALTPELVGELGWDRIDARILGRAEPVYPAETAVAQVLTAWAARNSGRPASALTLAAARAAGDAAAAASQLILAGTLPPGRQTSQSWHTSPAVLGIICEPLDAIAPPQRSATGEYVKPTQQHREVGMRCAAQVVSLAQSEVAHQLAIDARRGIG